MSSDSIVTVSSTNIKYANIDIPKDSYTSDDKLKYKLRSLNLIKYNPNLFTNTSEGNVTNFLGGTKTAVTVLGCGLISAIYKHQANKLRGVCQKIGIWNINFFFVYGCAVGALYSSIFFTKNQIIMNDYFAQFLFKRYPECKEISRSDIYRFNKLTNDDSEYYYSKSFANTAHL